MPVFVYVISIIMIALWLISVQLTVSVTLEYDMLANDGYFSLFFFGVSIMKISIKFVSFDARTRRVTLQLGKRKVSAVLAPKSDKDSVLNYIALPLIFIIDFIYFDIDFSFGHKSNAFATMLIVQTVRMAVCALTSMIKSSQELETEVNILPVYGKDILKISFYGIISASIANIIYSFFHALSVKNKRREYDYYGRKTRRKSNGNRVQ